MGPRNSWRLSTVARLRLRVMRAVDSFNGYLNLSRREFQSDYHNAIENAFELITIPYTMMQRAPSRSDYGIPLTAPLHPLLDPVLYKIILFQQLLDLYATLPQVIGHINDRNGVGWNALVTRTRACDVFLTSSCCSASRHARRHTASSLGVTTHPSANTVVTLTVTTNGVVQSVQEDAVVDRTGTTYSFLGRRPLQPQADCTDKDCSSLR